MPNYSLQINSHFKPFSFERYIQPLQIYGQAYKEQEEALNNLQMQANTVEAMINRARDTKAAERYDAYMQGLNDQAEALSTSGLLPGVRNSVNTLRGDYFNKIVPIQKAYETMMKQIEEQRKTGDTRINEYNAGDLSIDDFLENPEKTYRSIDRNNLYARSAAAYGTLQNELRDYSLQSDKKIKDNFQKAFVKKYGMSPEEATGFIDDVRTQIANGKSIDQIVGTNPVMMRIFNDLYTGSGVPAWGSRDAELQAANTILAGAMNSIGKEDISLVTNQAAVLQAQLNQAKEIARIKAGAKTNGAGINNRTAKPRTFASREDRKEGVNAWLKVKDSLVKNGGKWTVNNAPSTASGTYLYRNDSRYKAFKQLGLLDSNGYIIKDQSKIDEAVNKYTALANNDYDQSRYKELYEKFDPVDYPKVMSYISSLADKNNKVSGFDYKRREDGLPIMDIPGSVLMDLSDKETKDIEYAQLTGTTYKGKKGTSDENNKYGNTYIEVKFKNDPEHYKIPLPKEVEESMLDDLWYMSEIDSDIDAVGRGEFNMETEDLIQAAQKAAEYENSAFERGFKFFGTTKVKPITVKQEDSDTDMDSLLEALYGG